jgi:hypothetical protein
VPEIVNLRNPRRGIENAINLVFPAELWRSGFWMLEFERIEFAIGEALDFEDGTE